MPRTRAQLTESWDDVYDSDEDKAPIYSEDDERDELGSMYKPEKLTYADTQQEDLATRMRESRIRAGGTNGRSSGVANGDSSHKRTTRSGKASVEPELVMPASPDDVRPRRKTDMRAPTPHLRRNQRSLTSDAGIFRSMTGPRRSPREIKVEDEDEIEEMGRGRRRKQRQPSGPLVSILVPPLLYIWDVVKGALGMLFGMLGPVFALLLVAAVIIGALVLSSRFVGNTITTAMSPICNLPFVGFLNLPFCPNGSRYSSRSLARPVEFSKLMRAQATFEEMLDSAGNTAGLTIDLQRSYLAFADVKHLVQFSNLHSRNELVFELEEFIARAKQASNDLGNFNSRIDRAAGTIILENKYTQRTIEEIVTKETDRGAISIWMSDNLNILAPFMVKTSRDKVMNQYIRHAAHVEDEVVRLIDQAHALLNTLDELEKRLENISGIAHKDGIKAQENKDELLAKIWSILGGNRVTKAKLERQLSVLNQFGAYRRLAWAHVTATVAKLQQTKAELEDLRERVAVPQTVGDMVPLEVHIQTIAEAAERLTQRRDQKWRVDQENTARLGGDLSKGWAEIGTE